MFATFGLILLSLASPRAASAQVHERPRPPACAAHNWRGFPLGKWENDMLTIFTTHLRRAASATTAFPAAKEQP